MGSVNLYPIDVPYDTIEVDDQVKFDPSKLDYDSLWLDYENVCLRR